MKPKIVLKNPNGDISSVEFDASEMTFEFIYTTARYTEEKTVRVSNGYSETVALRKNEFNNLLGAGFEVRGIDGDIDFLKNFTPLERLDRGFRHADPVSLGPRVVTIGLFQRCASLLMKAKLVQFGNF